MQQEAGIVAIINDDKARRLGWQELVGDAGFQPVAIEGRFRTLEELASKIRSVKASYAICDNRLSPKGMAQFTGCSLAALLNESRTISSMVVTDFVAADMATICQYREKIPVLLRGEDFDDPALIRKSLLISKKEIIDRVIPPSRRPWRTLVQVVGVTVLSGHRIAEAYVPGWKPYETVYFPTSLIQIGGNDSEQRDRFYFARVNIGALNPEDLFFRDLELAPDPGKDE